MNHIVNDLGQLVEAAGQPGSPERVAAEYPHLITTLRDWNLLIQDRHQEKTEPLIYRPGMREQLAPAASEVERTLVGMDGDLFDKSDDLHAAHVLHFLGAKLNGEGTPALECVLLESAGWAPDFVSKWPGKRQEVNAQIGRELAAVRRENSREDYDDDEVPSRPYSLPRATAESVNLLQKDGHQAVMAKAGGLTRALTLPLLFGQPWAVIAEFDPKSPHVRPVIKGLHPLTGREISATFAFSPSIPASKAVLREDKPSAARPFTEVHGTTQAVAGVIMADINDAAKRDGHTTRVSAVLITDRNNIDSDASPGARGVNRLHLCSSVAYTQMFKAGSETPVSRKPEHMRAEARRAAPGVTFHLGSVPDDRLGGGEVDGILIEDVDIGEYTLRKVLDIPRGQPRFYDVAAKEFLSIASAVGQVASKADEAYYDSGKAKQDEASLAIKPMAPPAAPEGAWPLPARVEHQDGTTTRSFGGVAAASQESIAPDMI